MKSKSSHPGLTGMYRRFESAATCIAERIYSSLCSPLAERAHRLSRSGQFMELVSMTADPLQYTDAGLFRDDYLACELMSKFDSFELGVDRAQLAFDKFLSAEEQCRRTNVDWSERYVSGLTTPYTPESFLWTARVKIASMLGPFDWDEASARFGFGPGASTSLGRDRGDAYFKFGVVRPHTTKANSLLALAAVKSSPGWFNHLLGTRSRDDFLNLPTMKQVEELFEIVRGNKVTTVPKSAKIDRVIAIEPDLNMYVQKGIGSVLRSRLKRVGVNLDDQTWNQQLAHLASSTGEYATIDLSSASDTVSLRLVEELLPPDWFEAIKQSRSSQGTMPDGSVISYQKVSSMGNGFTFELESLIFWALCSSVISLLRPARRRLAIYGDDIIVSTEICHTVLWLLRWWGFTPNTAKTHVSGPFRESCGKHYFNGIDVTPFYIRRDVDSSSRLISTANAIRRWARTPFGLDKRLKVSYLATVNLLPKVLRRPTIPEHFGDVALFGDFDECSPQRAKHGWEGWKALGYQEVFGNFRPEEPPLMVRNLSILDKSRVEVNLDAKRRSLDLSTVSRRSRTVKWGVVKPLAVQWESYGYWL